MQISAGVSPLPPLSPPVLVELNDSFFQVGQFSVNLTDAVGDRDSVGETPLNGFLFQVRDLATNNITYIWQVPQKNVLVYRSNEK